jgi:biotin carboxyl carrier protein
MKAKANDKYDFNIDVADLNWDCVEVKNGQFHILHDNKSFVADVVEADYSTKNFKIQINGNLYEISLSDRFDDLLQELGMESTASVENNIKAPMPGRVLNISIQAGDAIAKGDNLLVLEAMKMENIIKSPREGVIKSLEIEAGATVEKNQLLITFE